MTEQEINQTIADNLVKIRRNTYHYKMHMGKLRKKFITQTEVAKKLNITFQQITKYESGQNQVSCAKLKMIADYFDVPIEKFFTPIETYYREFKDENVNHVALDN
jgi:transcriptional regulator with XRE-family HTH domain